MRSNVYERIISMFEMSDKPSCTFDPNSDNFIDLVKYSLKKAFGDFNFRTLKKTAEFSKEYDKWKNEVNNRRKEQRQNKALVEDEPTMTDYLMRRLEEKGFLDRFKTFFTTPCKDFDDWHNKSCEMFLNVLNGDGEYKDCLKVYENLRYGKAQKIVNMMFKHLYCFENANAYADHFKHCHMVLDNFTLEWFKRTLNEKRIDSWSNLVYKKGSVDCNDYMFYQEKIRAYFSADNTDEHTYKGLTPFQAEFYIWPETQWLLAAEALLSQHLPEELNRSELKIAEDDSIVALCDQLIKQLNTLKNHYKK